MSDIAIYSIAGRELYRDPKAKLMVEAVESAVAHGVSLRLADLVNADLGGTILYGADLRRADMAGAKLVNADLFGARLGNAIFDRADMRGADLLGADLDGAILRGARLRNADLDLVSLRNAILINADLHWASLRVTDLHGANLDGANLRGADMEGCSIPPIFADACGYELRRIRIGHQGEYFVAGCRQFNSRAEALAHWGASDYPDPERGAAYCAAINSQPLGWAEREQRA